MKIQELLDYMEMSKRIAEEILHFDGKHTGALQAQQSLSRSQESVKTSLRGAADALKQASNVIEKYHLEAHTLNAVGEGRSDEDPQ